MSTRTRFEEEAKGNSEMAYYVTDNVGTAGSKVSCEVHGTTHREFLESFFSEMAQFVKFVGAKLVRYSGGQL